MCDTLVVVCDNAVWFAKNSDREPGEAQAVEHRARERHTGSRRLHATHIELDQVPETNEVVLSRPTWMWGAEMGANEHGLAIGNEAVFTRVPAEKTGLLGMDLVRLALERCASADEALALVTWMLARHGQGGSAGFRDRGFAYHNAFLIADPRGAWLLETAGRFWAAVRVEKGARSTSNVLTIGADYMRLGPGTIEGARSLGLLRRGETFDFRKCFGRPVMAWLSGGDVRRACTLRGARSVGGLADILEVLRGHGGLTPEAGARIMMPCAHASWLPTRGHGQTTGTMIARLAPEGSRQWLTGTSAPCLSVIKEVPLGRGHIDTGPTPSKTGFDGASLWWRAERLHRTVLKDYAARRAAFEDERRELEAKSMANEGADARAIWEEHRERVVAWAERVARMKTPGTPRTFDAWWRLQSWRDGVPA